MTKEIEKQIKEFINQINYKLNTSEQEILDKIINNYINLSKTLNKITVKHNQKEQ